MEPVTLEICSNGLAIITIDRQRVLNCADCAMCEQIHDAVNTISDTASLKAVLVRGAGQKGLCSGGDVKCLREALSKDPVSELPKDQVFHEYVLIYKLRQLAVPTVSLVHGITMGFGLGLGGAARYRVATEASRFAMPENNIGIFPDACWTYTAANTCPPGIGELVALTGCHIRGAGDALGTKLATHFVPFDRLETLVESLKNADFGDDSEARTRTCIEAVAETAPESMLLKNGASLLSKLSAAGSVDEAVATLESEAQSGDWAAEFLPMVKRGSPFSQALAWRQLEKAKADVAANRPEKERLAMSLEREYRVISRCFYRPDFSEGVRATLVDKDNSPVWQPGSLAEVSAEEVARCFAQLPAGERTLGLTTEL